MWRGAQGTSCEKRATGGFKRNEKVSTPGPVVGGQSCVAVKRRRAPESVMETILMYVSPNFSLRFSFFAISKSRTKLSETLKKNCPDEFVFY